MAVFVELTTEPFTQVFQNMVNGSSPGGVGLPSVRRPTRGLEIKNATYAYLKLIRSDGSEVSLFDSSDPSGMSTHNSNFILQQVQDQRMEKHQVVETFGDTYIFFFGEAPRFLQCTATLINSFDFQWKAEFLQNYDTYLRGTKAIEQSARTYLFYDDNIVEGYMLNTVVAESATDPMNIQMQFQFFVTNYRNIAVINGQYPTRDSAKIPDDVSLTNTLTSDQIQELIGNGAGIQDFDTAARSAPLRGAIADNTDEWTGQRVLQANGQNLLGGAGLTNPADDNPFDPTNSSPMTPPDDGVDDVDDLPMAVSQDLGNYGVDPDSADDPFTMDDLGIGVLFLSFGVGVGFGQGQVGAQATFGAAAPGGFYVAGFTGVGLGIGAQAQTGFSGFGGAFAGVGASASAGAYQGSQYAPGAAPFGALPGSTQSTTTPYQNQQAAVSGGLSSAAFGAAAAYASASKSAQQPSATGAAVAAAAQAGGYASSNSYLGLAEGTSYIGASYAGQSGAGASVSVGGASTAFSINSLPGTLTGAPTISPATAHC